MHALQYRWIYLNSIVFVQNKLFELVHSFATVIKKTFRTKTLNKLELRITRVDVDSCHQSQNRSASPCNFLYKQTKINVFVVVVLAQTLNSHYV